MALSSRRILYAALPLPLHLVNQATSLHIAAPAMDSFREQLTSSEPGWSGQFGAQLAGRRLSITHATKGGLPIWRPSLLGEAAPPNGNALQDWAGHWALVSDGHVPPQAALVIWLCRNQPAIHRTSPLLLVRLQVQQGRLCSETCRILEGQIDPATLTAR